MWKPNGCPECFVSLLRRQTALFMMLFLLLTGRHGEWAGESCACRRSELLSVSLVVKMCVWAHVLSVFAFLLLCSGCSRCEVTHWLCAAGSAVHVHIWKSAGLLWIDWCRCPSVNKQLVLIRQWVVCYEIYQNNKILLFWISVLQLQKWKTVFWCTGKLFKNLFFFFQREKKKKGPGHGIKQCELIGNGCVCIMNITS